MTVQLSVPYTDPFVDQSTPRYTTMRTASEIL